MEHTLTQEEVNADIAEFKSEVLALSKDGESITMAILLNKELLGEIVMYEEDIAPAIRAMGLHAPSVSELFGVKISITEK